MRWLKCIASLLFLDEKWELLLQLSHDIGFYPLFFKVLMWVVFGLLATGLQAVHGMQVLS